MNANIFLRHTLLAAATLLATFCKDADDAKEQVIGSGLNDVSTATAHMGLDVLKVIHANEQGQTILISPLSIQMAFNMALEAARASSFDQITAVMHYPALDLQAIRRDALETANVLVNQSGHPSVTIANAFFYDPMRLDPKQAFIDALTDHYGASVVADDFSKQAAVDNINDWVYAKTKGLIEEIMEDITDDELAFIINALHFKSDWADAFDEAMTRKDEFTQSNGTVLTVDFMSKDGQVASVITNDWEMVDLPFKDSTFSLSLVRSADNLQSNWLQYFTMTDLNGLYDKLQVQRIYLRVPKMDLEYDYELSGPLKDLGMTDPFSESRADLTAMGTPLQGPRTYITRVDHKTVLKVDEKGAEGAALTSIGIGVTSMPPSIRFNVPYLLSLRHIPSGAILFMGFVEDPT